MTRRAIGIGSMLLVLVALLAAAPPAMATGSGDDLGYLPPAGQDVLPAGICEGDTTRRSVRCLVNHLRKQHGRRALKGNRVLQQAADRYARRMSAESFFGHVDPDGGRVVQRIAAISRWKDWRWVGEVIGWSCLDHSAPRQVVNAWWASPPHRTVLLDRRSRRIGIGVAPGTPFECDGRTWAIQVGVKFDASRSLHPN